MKKISIFMILLVMFMMVISGCGKDESVKGSNDKKNKLIIVTDATWNPFEYLDNGQVVGFDIDLIKAVAEQAGYEYEIKNDGWSAMFAQLQNKTADVAISGITITEDRKQTYDFSKPYFVSKQSILVKADSDVTSTKDLKGKIIAVQSGSTGEVAIEKLFGKNNENIKKEKANVRYLDLINGNAEAVVADDVNNKKFMEGNPKEKLKLVQDEGSFDKEYFGIMYPKESSVKADFDKALTVLYENGKFVEIYKKWFKEEPHMSELTGK